jgi:hypothetical protein
MRTASDQEKRRCCYRLPRGLVEYCRNLLTCVGTSHLWSLLVFAYHQVRATGRPADGLFRQQQALLRTLPPPSSLVAESTKLWWSWRKRNNRVLVRSLTPFLLASFCTVGFIAASITSSFVVNNSDLEVLVHSPFCGHLNSSMPINAARVQLAAIRAVSGAYAEDCYQNFTILPARCKAYVKPRINYTIARVPCPFNTEFCTDVGHGLESTPAVAVDSGLVELNRGFGLNLPPKDRVSYRRKTTCSVLQLAGRTSIINASDFPPSLRTRDTYPEEELMLLHLGDRPQFGDWKNVTTFASLLTINVTKGYNVA